MDKIVFVFNKFYTCLIKDLKKKESLKERIRKHYKAIDKLSREHIDFFLDEFEEGLLEPNKEKCVLRDIKLQEAVDATGQDQDVFWNYFNILSALALVKKEYDAEDADEDNVNVLADSVLSILNKTQKGESVQDDISVILQDDIQEILKKVKKVELETVQDGATPPPSDNPFMNMFKGMENSKICNLAQEISNDINVGDMKMDSPEDIMKLLDFSSSNNIMGDIIQKVSSKMHEKITNGELKQEELFGEAMNMMGKMNLGGMAGGLGGLGSMFNNPMMSEMFKMAKKGKAKPRSDVFKSASSRDRLRKKLEERRKNNA